MQQLLSQLTLTTVTSQLLISDHCWGQRPLRADTRSVLLQKGYKEMFNSLGLTFVFWGVSSIRRSQNFPGTSLMSGWLIKPRGALQK